MIRLEDCNKIFLHIMLNYNVLNENVIYINLSSSSNEKNIAGYNIVIDSSVRKYSNGKSLKNEDSMALRQATME